MGTCLRRTNCGRWKGTGVVHPHHPIPGRDLTGTEREGLYEDTVGGSKPRVT
jgi:hypothetical protein